MKKKLLFVTIILILLAGVLYYISLPDYLVFNSMSFSNGANRDTELQVIVYQYWNTDEVVAEIEAEHNQINGTPTTLTINLHRSKWSFHNGYEPFYTTTINYDWKGKADSRLKNCLLQTGIYLVLVMLFCYAFLSIINICFQSFYIIVCQSKFKNLFPFFIIEYS